MKPKIRHSNVNKFAEHSKCLSIILTLSTGLLIRYTITAPRVLLICCLKTDQITDKVRSYSPLSDGSRPSPHRLLLSNDSQVFSNTGL